MTATTATPGTRTRGPFDTDERLLQQHRVGPVDRLPAGGILALLPQLPDWPAATVHRTRRLKGAGTILDWLNAHPGEGWQDRWTVSGADRDTSWIEMLAPGDTRRAVTKRQEHIAGLGCLLMCRVVLPSYDFLAAYRAKGLLNQVREIMRPDTFARLENAAAERGMSGRDKGDALCVISKIVLHTGTDVDALTPGDVLEMFAWSVHADPPRRQVPGLHAAWDLLGAIGVTPAGTTLRSAQRRGQRTTAELVDDYSSPAARSATCSSATLTNAAPHWTTRPWPASPASWRAPSGPTSSGTTRASIPFTCPARSPRHGRNARGSSRTPTARYGSARTSTLS